MALKHIHDRKTLRPRNHQASCKDSAAGTGWDIDWIFSLMSTPLSPLLLYPLAGEHL